MEVDTCSREHQIIGVMVFLNIMAILIDCISSCKRYNEIKTLKHENESLKSMLIKSIDKVFIRMMKNGNYLDEDHDD